MRGRGVLGERRHEQRRGGGGGGAAAGISGGEGEAAEEEEVVLVLVSEEDEVEEETLTFCEEYPGKKSSKLHVAAVGRSASDSRPLDRTCKLPTGNRERPVQNRKSFECCWCDICSTLSQK